MAGDGEFPEVNQSDLREVLAAFNRKERFALVGQALDNPSFIIGRVFARTLGGVIRRRVPEDAFVAMDYHLDWLYAALCWHEGSAMLNEPKPRQPGELDEEGQPVYLDITGAQTDIDLIVAWTNPLDHRSHLALVEAKGWTSWAGAPLAHKMQRLRFMFGEGPERRGFPGVEVHLVLAGPKPSTHLKVEGWPLRAQDGNGGPRYFLPLLPPDHATFAVMRCDSNQVPEQEGEFWAINPSPWP